MEISEAIINFCPAFIDEHGKLYFHHDRQAKSLSISFPNTKPISFLKIPEGSFLMGSRETDLHVRRNEYPQHKVKVRSFYLGQIPITQHQWMAVTGQKCRGNSNSLGQDLPVVNVWLDEAINFCDKLSKLTNLSVRLPSEAEWEYACRAGTNTPFCYGESLTTEVAKYAVSALEISRLKIAGEIDAPNDFGLLDMHGNVWEWCSDIWHEDYKDAPADGSSWISGGDVGYCVQRGGSWRSHMDTCRSAMRVGDIARNDEDIVGLRVCFSV